MLTRDQFVSLLRETQNGRNAKQFAAFLGVSEQYLSDIYRNRRDPGEGIAKKLKFEKRVMYIPRKRK